MTQVRSRWALIRKEPIDEMQNRMAPQIDALQFHITVKISSSSPLFMGVEKATHCNDTTPAWRAECKCSKNSIT